MVFCKRSKFAKGVMLQANGEARKAALSLLWNFQEKAGIKDIKNSQILAFRK